MEKTARIYVAGAQTLIGSAILGELKQQGYTNVVGKPGEEPELTDASQMEAFFSGTKPEYVFLVGGRSGGIGANQKYPAGLMLENLLVACHVIDSAHRHRVKKLLYLASSCCYPKHCPQPMRVESLLTGPLEPTSEAYAVAKIAGIRLSQAYRKQHGANFISGIPADVFGPGEGLNPEDSHVVPALMWKMLRAKRIGAKGVDIWGTGTPRREFLFADDVADACLFLMWEYDDPQPINIGGGSDLSIRELAVLMKEIVGFAGDLHFDTSRPDGLPLKILDSSRLHGMGWRPKTTLRSALEATLEGFTVLQENQDKREIG